MWYILLLIACLQAADAQETYRCQCGFFVVEQFGGQIGDAAPIPFRGITQSVSPSVCNEPTAGNNTCKYLCNQWAETAPPDIWCQNNPDIQLCYGGLYCGALLQDNRLPAEGISSGARVYFRMPQCPESTEHRSWSLGDYEYPDALCCDGDGNYDSCYDDCTCLKVNPLAYCECGIFTEVQHQEVTDGSEPVPFRLFSDVAADDVFSFCDIWEVDPPNEECEAMCSPWAESYFASYSLLDSAHNDYNVEVGTTYGQVYCNALRSRLIFYNQYIRTTLRLYKRAPYCVPTNTWQALAFGRTVVHPEELCCNEQGVHEYPCPNPRVV